MQHRQASLCLAIVLSFSNAGYSTDIHVSWSQGNDANDGRTASHPWKSLARVNATGLRPGDRILLHRGDQWHETLRPPSSGTRGHRIVFGAYGIGHAPLLDGRLQATATLDANIDNNAQSHILYRDLDMRNAREGLRIYSSGNEIRDIAIEHCRISSAPTVPGHPVSAGVYVNVQQGRIQGLLIRNNRVIPHAFGLEHWGVYIVAGASGFRIENNVIGPAGEDAITIWHSDHGRITGNHGGGNGENTIDVKDSQNIAITENFADNDREYNIVAHDVDTQATRGIRILHNHCLRGGQGGKLSAGIAILNVRGWRIEDNLVSQAFGAAVLIRVDSSNAPGRITRNQLQAWGRGQHLPPIVVQGTSTPMIFANLLRP